MQATPSAMRTQVNNDPNPFQRTELAFQLNNLTTDSDSSANRIEEDDDLEEERQNLLESTRDAELELSLDVIAQGISPKTVKDYER